MSNLQVTITHLNQVVLMPRKTMTMNSGNNRCILINSDYPVLFEHGRQKFHGGSSTDLVLGEQMKVMNPSSSRVHLSSIVFEIKGFHPLKRRKLLRIQNDDLCYYFTNFVSRNEDAGCNEEQMEQALKDCFLMPTIEHTNPASVLHGKIDSRLIYVNRYIRKYYSEPITLHDLALMINVNPVYLSNTYSQVFSISLMKHLQLIRMQQAEQFIVTTQMNIKEIATSVGYISSSQFASYFKRYKGISPYDYRKEFSRMNSKEFRKRYAED